MKDAVIQKVQKHLPHPLPVKVYLGGGAAAPQGDAAALQTGQQQGAALLAKLLQVEPGGGKFVLGALEAGDVDDIFHHRKKMLPRLLDVLGAKGDVLVLAHPLDNL